MNDIETLPAVTPMGEPGAVIPVFESATSNTHGWCYSRSSRAPCRHLLTLVACVVVSSNPLPLSILVYTGAFCASVSPASRELSVNCVGVSPVMFVPSP